ncbi:AAA family ATPase [Streptomyces sviceus]|uniref:AAA family ATPase n=1 Tax=Streptomyces sviceus TaxID=285530 RepID=UPI00331DD090
MDMTLTLSDGTRIDGTDPVVVLGPNGSGKTRQARTLQAAAPIEFINALRNTRVAPELQAMGVLTARNNFNSQRQQAASAHWELASEFDSMLAQLLAQQSMVAIEFTQKYRQHGTEAGQPEETPLTQVEDTWKKVFPGRELVWRDWKPTVISTTAGPSVEYSGNQMSDGEKAALFLTGRVFSADPGILVVDEPETHFHSMLAVKLWDALEAARPDIRFVYVTHDLTFALSRRKARFVLASPTGGLRAIDVDSSVPRDVAEALLGSASLSFYASRVIFCEGETSAYDDLLYGAWFNGRDTVVRPVGSCQMVLRCCDALRKSGIANALEAVGIIDRDYNPDAFINGVPNGIHVLDVHEVESLFCLPEVVKAVCSQTAVPFDEAAYLKSLVDSVDTSQRHSIVVQRWKARIEPSLAGVIAQVSTRQSDLAALVADMPNIFDHTRWSFSPQDLLEEEKQRVEAVIPNGSAADFLMIAPGKQLLHLAARTAGMDKKRYVDLIIKALGDADVSSEASLVNLGTALEAAFKDHLPPRRASQLVSPDGQEEAPDAGVSSTETHT